MSSVSLDLSSSDSSPACGKSVIFADLITVLSLPELGPRSQGDIWHSVYCVRCRLIPDNQLVSNSLDFLLFKNLLAPPHFPAFRYAHCSLCSALNDDNNDVKEEKLATSLDTIELL